MKTIIRFIKMLSVVLFGFTCGESGEEVLPVGSCDLNGEVVFTVSDEVGRLTFHETTSTFYLSYHVPDTYDLVLVGIVCNMPDGAPKEPEYIAVTFSGVFRALESDSGALGLDQYNLVLKQIDFR